MSLIKQVWSLVIGILIFACLGCVVFSVLSARNYLENQLAIKNHDTAASLALTLSQRDSNRTMLERGISTQFDTGHYKSILLRSSGGLVIIERSMDLKDFGAPVWFSELITIDSPAGHAQVMSGWKQLGTIEVISHTGFAYADLWTGTLRLVGWMFVIAIGGVTIGHRAVQRLRQPLDLLAKQADKLVENRFAALPKPIPMPKTPELKRVVEAVNQMVMQIRALFAEQSTQIEALRRATTCDPLTGVAHRQHFLAEAGATLDQQDGNPVGGLLLIRLNKLSDLNVLVGRARTDALLRDIAIALSHPLAGYPDSVLHVGRLNGTDFGLLVAASDDLRGLANAWLERVRQLVAAFPAATVTVSGAAMQPGMGLMQLMLAADLALAQAEARGSKAAEIESGQSATSQAGGEAAWRRQLIGALTHPSHARLEEFPVIDRTGQTLHAEARLRLQLVDGGPFTTANIWLPMAMRTRLTARLDEMALTLALQDISRDGQPRAISIALLSLRSPEFVLRLVQGIKLAPKAAASLWVEVDEDALASYPMVTAELCRVLRAYKVRVGLEHAGERLQAIGVLQECGLDYVKLSADFTAGVATDAEQAVLVRSACTLLHGLKLQVIAEGATDPADLEALWACGVDGVSGRVQKE
ncbi:LapD/MoxY N-terminal periplasmic domain-containing protein [Leptothrix ochracea]|uniref:bifunctional diguanylate cyclase/phosphodiesterase n=1 Tax=Leptothrix ochracea TaxID=735331 RepID=UPI0034E269B8